MTREGVKVAVQCSNIYPTSCVRGVVPADSIWKTGGNVVAKIGKE